MTMPTLAQVEAIDDVVLLAPEFELVPEDSEHARLVDLLYAGLAARFADVPDVAVHVRLGWFPDREDTRVRLDPDVMVAFGRPQRHRRSFRTWAEDGAVPTVVLEVVSGDDTDLQYEQRLARMRRYGVAEVVLVSPFAPGGVRVEHLLPDAASPTRYRTVAVSADATHPIPIDRLGIELAGGDDLVVREDEHEAWPDTPTAFARARRADAEAARADAEAARADGEAARAARLADAVRAAGIDPDAV